MPCLRFERHLVVPGEAAGTIVHAQLIFEGNMVMLDTAKPESRERFRMVAPSSTGGLVTGCICISLDDPDAHHARAAAHGAEIIGTLRDNDYGGRGYDARDPEGYAWSFSSYDPWA